MSASTAATEHRSPESSPADEGVDPPLPWLRLIVLASTTFIALVSEMLPAGLLTPMAADLGVSESGAGLLVTVYALASGLGAIPLIALTRSVSRQRLLLVVMGLFAASNLLTALVDDYAAMLVVRLIGGLATGLIWSMVGGYAAAIVPLHQRGRALSVVLGGGSVGFTAGLPASSALGALVGWRWSFAVVGIAALLVFALAAVLLPRVAGEPEEDRDSLLSVIRRPGVLAIGAVALVLVTGHYSLYTYLDPFVQRAGLENGVSAALLLFGGGSMVGMFASGRFIDRDLRRTLLVSVSVILLMLSVFGLFGISPVVTIGSCLIWGLFYGALTPLMQTASLRAGGAAAAVAVSVTVTAWSLGIALGAVVGGVALDARGAGFLPWVALALTAVAALIAVASRRGFPPRGAAASADSPSNAPA